jgi:hypothetical protein
MAEKRQREYAAHLPVVDGAAAASTSAASTSAKAKLFLDACMDGDVDRAKDLAEVAKAAVAELLCTELCVHHSASNDVLAEFLVPNWHCQGELALPTIFNACKISTDIPGALYALQEALAPDECDSDGELTSTCKLGFALLDELRSRSAWFRGLKIYPTDERATCFRRPIFYYLTAMTGVKTSPELDHDTCRLFRLACTRGDVAMAKFVHRELVGDDTELRERCLLEHGAMTGMGYPTLTLAATRGHLNVVKYLVDDLDARVTLNHPYMPGEMNDDGMGAFLTAVIGPSIMYAHGLDGTHTGQERCVCSTRIITIMC